MVILNSVHPEWLPIVQSALQTVPVDYLNQLKADQNWLPGENALLNAFSLPLSKTRYILFGESPYPRSASANGYAFWDNSVHDLWTAKGFSTQLNRATSLRNILKMLLIAENLLKPDDLTQIAISQIDKSTLVSSLRELFNNVLRHGFLLLNASLVLSDKPVQLDAKAWQPFMISLLTQIHHQKPDLMLILFGKIAEQINRFPIATQFKQLKAEHPYNLSFITQPEVLDFFKPLHLLRKSV